jgi:peptidoglycan/LPS O-acetylase OafA/YrhL
MKDKRRLDGLTGLRAVAALQVVFFHFGALAFNGTPEFVHAVQRTGHAAVSLFFVLSGFVLAYNYEEPMMRGTVSRWRFWLARFARVYPLYALVVLAEVPLMWKGIPRGILAYATVGDLAGLQAFIPAITNVANTPGWSVSAELFFYVLFPFFIVRPERKHGIVLWCVVGLLVAWLPSRFHWTTPIYTFVKSAPIIRLPEFLVGVALGRAYLRAPRLSPQVSSALTGSALVAILAVSLAHAMVPRYYIHAVFVPAYSLLIWGIAHGGFLSGVLGRPTMRVLGDSSYALYLLQVPLAQLTGNNYQRPLLSLCGWVALLTFISYLVHRFVERPLQRKILDVSAPLLKRVAYSGHGHSG